jgi:predicted ATP-dependent endonuclease of OLD family
VLAANLPEKARVTMFISRLFIKNFRNLRHLDVDLRQGVTCFIGENNSGKTNVFHALREVTEGVTKEWTLGCVQR